MNGFPCREPQIRAGNRDFNGRLSN